MLKLSTRILVYKKNEETNVRELDFPYTQELSEHIVKEIEFLINGVHLVNDEGEIYVLNVDRTERID